MKTFVCGKSEAVVIKDEVFVTVLDIRDEEVVLEVDAPEWVEVFPEEASDEAETKPPGPRRAVWGWSSSASTTISPN